MTFHKIFSILFSIICIGILVAYFHFGALVVVALLGLSKGWVTCASLLAVAAFLYLYHFDQLGKSEEKDETEAGEVE